MKQKRRLDPDRQDPETETFENKLRQLVVGQDAAIGGIVSAYQSFLAGMNPPGRPISNFLFLGPTGSGKTKTVEATAEVIYGDPKAIVKIDCAEFRHSHEIARLIGSPPGYVGHRETNPLLSQEALNQHHTDATKLSFVLFDEIEKASDALWDLLLGILDKATLTLGDNRKVDFSCAMVFMTSNLAAKEMEDLLRPRFGFNTAASSNNREKLTAVGTAAAQKRFTPEFMNRIDRVITFQPLGTAELQKILQIELREVQKRIDCGASKFVFTVTPRAAEFLLQEGTDERYGARHLKRTIERCVVHPLSKLKATRQVTFGDLISVDLEEGKIVFFREKEGLSIETMVRMGAEQKTFFEAVPPAGRSLQIPAAISPVAAQV